MMPFSTQAAHPKVDPLTEITLVTGEKMTLFDYVRAHRQLVYLKYHRPNVFDQLKKEVESTMSDKFGEV